MFIFLKNFLNNIKINKNIFRAYFSIKEHDDTTKQNNSFKLKALIWISATSQK